MTKKEIISELAERTGLSTSAATKMAETYIDIIKDAFAEGEPVYLRGFGSFALKKRKATKGRDISKGTPVVIPERTVIKFIPSPSLIIKQ